MSKVLRIITIVSFLCCVALCAGIGTSYCGYAGEYIDIEYIFNDIVLDRVPVMEGTVLTEGRELDIDPDNEEWKGYTVEWRFGSADGNAVRYPYTVKESDAVNGKIVLYGIKVPVDIIIEIFAGRERTEIICGYGEIPVLPENVFGSAVSNWYLDENFETAYILSAVKNPFALYPLFTDRTVNVTVDGKIVTVAYGSVLEPLENTDTHRFAGYLFDGRIFDGRAIFDISLTASFERIRYRVTVIKDGMPTKLYYELDEDVDIESLKSYGDKFYTDKDGKNETLLPMDLTDDIVLYAFENTPEDPVVPENTAYKISNICEHGELSAKSEAQEGELIEITVFDMEDGYALDAILVDCGGVPVAVSRDGNNARFIMPSGNVTISAKFIKESESGNQHGDSQASDKNKIHLENKEIIAIVISAVAVSGAAVFFIVKKMKERKDKSGKEKIKSE